MREQLKTIYQFSRIGVGAGFLAAPGVNAKLWGIEPAPSTLVIGRMFGVRDAMIGVGQVLGSRHGSARGWYEAAAVCDLVDAVVMGAAGATGTMRRSTAIIGMSVAAAFAGVGVWLARTEPVDGPDPLDAELAALTRAEAAT